MTSRPTSRPLMLLACAALCAVAALPTAAADATDDLPKSIHVQPPVDADMPLPVEIVEQAEDLLEQLMRGIQGPDVDRMVHLEHAGLNVTVECRTNGAGQTQCYGVVCEDDGGTGDEPYTLGPGGEGVTVGVDPDLKRNPDGSYGPYEAVHVSPSNECSCSGWVRLPWV